MADPDSSAAGRPSPFARKPPPPRDAASGGTASPPPLPPLPSSGSYRTDPSIVAPRRESRRLFFHGSGGSLFGIFIVNTLLTLVTLGLYYFWAKVRVRTYVLSQSEIEGDRFAYHGTGRELLLGFLKAIVFFAVPIVVLSFVRDVLDVWVGLKVLAGLLVYLLVVVFIPVATVGARRYRLSRSSWRGIRFSFRGRARDFVRIFVVGSAVSSVTFGLYYPFFDVQRYAFMAGQAWFGTRQFGFTGAGRDLFGPFLLALLLTPFTLGLVWFWYLARRRRYLWDHTTFGAARFRCAVTAAPLFRLLAGNLLLLVLTLGLGWPWAKVRTIRFAFRYLTLEGPLDLTAIQQDARAASATGEGLAGLLDAGGGFDLG
ncbi:MAG: DUF898 family protein [Candidatus Rokubacteria bacterium]|nr:DUF898 family protein [Candidatus Rokubacteria bacterium]